MIIYKNNMKYNVKIIKKNLMLISYFFIKYFVLIIKFIY